MFGFLKNLLRRSEAEANGADETPDLQTATATEYVQPPLAPARGKPPENNGHAVELPVAKILEGLPLELHPRIRQSDPGPLTVSVPLEKILSQLSRGVVKVSFGELRQAVPGIFTSENDRDRVMVALPLAEILCRLNPALITRRRAQQQVQVPADIASPFDLNGSASYFSSNAPAEPHPAPAPAARANTPAPGAPPARNRGAINSVPAPVPPAAASLNHAPRLTAPAPTAPPAPAPTPARPAPAPALKPEAPIRFTAPARPAQSAAPATTAPKSQTEHRRAPAPKMPAPAPVLPKPVPAPEPRVVLAATAAPPPARPAPQPAHQPAHQPAPLPAAQPVAPAPAPAAALPEPKPAATTEPPVMLTLSALTDGWPDAVRKEIVELNLLDAQIAIPASSIEQGLKQGRVAFAWKTVRSWVKPAVLATTSPHDGTVVEVPLKVVAPVYLALQKEAAKPHEKVAVNEDIPNLFFGYPQTDEVASTVTAPRPSDTNFYVWGDSSDTVLLHESEVKRGSTPGTKFVAKYATPNEVVSRAAGMDGVAGALIALPDGLMVASQMPSELNGDTVAAFLPQIFGKVSQCTKELRMGDLNNLNFTVGNVPWKIFRVNAIFFAAFGRAGEPLPTAQLAALAAELDHKPR